MVWSVHLVCSCGEDVDELVVTLDEADALVCPCGCVLQAVSWAEAVAVDVLPVAAAA